MKVEEGEEEKSINVSILSDYSDEEENEEEHKMEVKERIEKLMKQIETIKIEIEKSEIKEEEELKRKEKNKLKNKIKKIKLREKKKQEKHHATEGEKKMMDIQEELDKRYIMDKKKYENWLDDENRDYNKKPNKPKRIKVLKESIYKFLKILIERELKEKEKIILINIKGNEKECYINITNDLIFFTYFDEENVLNYSFGFDLTKKTIIKFIKDENEENKFIKIINRNLTVIIKTLLNENKIIKELEKINQKEYSKEEEEVKENFKFQIEMKKKNEKKKEKIQKIRTKEEEEERISSIKEKVLFLKEIDETINEDELFQTLYNKSDDDDDDDDENNENNENNEKEEEEEYNNKNIFKTKKSNIEYIIFDLNKLNQKYDKYEGIIIKNYNFFGVSLSEIMKRKTEKNNDVPNKFSLLHNYLLEYAHETKGIYIHINILIKGIFRIPGEQIYVDLLIDKINLDKELKFEGKKDIEIVSGIYKSFFRDLPEPLLTFDLYESFLKIGFFFFF
jgi:hypothetical protein